MGYQWEVDGDDAIDEWRACEYPDNRQRVRLRLWELECRLIGPPFSESLPDPFDPSLYTYLHPAARVFIIYEVDGHRVTIVRIDPVPSD